MQEVPHAGKVGQLRDRDEADKDAGQHREIEQRLHIFARELDPREHEVDDQQLDGG